MNAVGHDDEAPNPVVKGQPQGFVFILRLDLIASL